jgi:hypothetical protein
MGAAQRIAHATPNDFGGPWRVCEMLEQDAGRKPSREFAVSSALEMRGSQTNDPQQGARLVRAFLQITDSRVRLAIVQMVEKVGSAAAVDC